MNNKILYRVIVFFTDGNADTFHSDEHAIIRDGVILWKVDEYHTTMYSIATIFKVEETQVDE